MWGRRGAFAEGESDIDNTGSALVGMIGGSGVVAVVGDRPAGQRLVRSLIGLLVDMPGNRVFVANATLPLTVGLPLSDLLDRIDVFPEDGPAARTFVFCGEPSRIEAARLRLLAAHIPGLTVVALGVLPGAQLTMRVSAGGRLTFERLAGVDVHDAYLPEPTRAAGALPPLPRRIANVA